MAEIVRSKLDDKTMEVARAIEMVQGFAIDATAEQLLELADEKFDSGIRKGWYDRIVDGIADFGYSVRNTILILLQNPTATKVDSMSGWNYHGRAIVKGSHGMKILSPVFDGKKATGYKVSFVFDEGQTVASASGKGVKEVRGERSKM